METTPSVIHEALKPLSWLSGRWHTSAGNGKYPNIPDFQYHEDLEFVCIGQPMYNFSSKSKHQEKQIPLHLERGFLRIKPGTNEIAFIISHNFGVTSVEEGSYDPEKKEISLESVSVTRMSFAKPPAVKRLARKIRLVDTDLLEITLAMETENTPLTEHLKAVYTRVVE